MKHIPAFVLSALYAAAIVFASLLFSGCSAAGEAEAAEVTPIRLSPSPEAEPFLEAAIERWVRAGVRADAIELVPDGAPVSVVDERIDKNDGTGGKADGATWSTNGLVDSMLIWRGKMTLQLIWDHEVGHALGMMGRHSESPDSLMFPTVGPVLDEESLVAVCEVSPCYGFNPDN